MVENPKLPEFDESSPLRPARFSHIVLRSARYQEMVDWYKTFLNAEPLFENGRVCFLTYDDEHHRLLVGHDPDAKPRPEDAEGVGHWAYLFNDLGELMTSYERLKGEGYVPKYAVNHGFQVSIYYRDPDNNEVELGCDVFETRQELNDWFAKGYFRDNFFGHVFDPDEVLKWHHEGVPSNEVFERTYPVEERTA